MVYVRRRLPRLSRLELSSPNRDKRSRPDASEQQRAEQRKFTMKRSAISKHGDAVRRVRV